MKTRILAVRIALPTLLILSFRAPLPAQIHGETASKKVSIAIPQHLVYRHFLGWINDLDKKAVANQAGDPYEFAKPLRSAHLETAHLDSVRREARSLDYDLSRNDATTRMIITAYRVKAQEQLRAGQPLPPAPPELRQLQAARTALLVQHMVNLQMALGPAKTAELGAYMKREITPHISLKPLLHAPASMTTDKQAFH